jgi:hypothetical protein
MCNSVSLILLSTMLMNNLNTHKNHKENRKLMQFQHIMSALLRLTSLLPCGVARSVESPLQSAGTSRIRSSYFIVVYVSVVLIFGTL